MENRPIKTLKSVIFIIMLSLAVTSSSCGGQNMQELVRAVMGTCGEHTVFLNSWYLNVEDESNIDLDPIGGYLYLYWIDENGYVCHGVPGVSGQPGPEIIVAWVDESYTAIEEYAVISLSQLDDMQVIPFELGSYSGEGMHFAQFANWKWRGREDGKVFSAPLGFHYAVPDIVSLNSEFCLLPVYAYDFPKCALGSGLQVPNPADILYDGPDQDPEMCHNRVMPNTFSLTISERAAYCYSR